MGIDIEFYRAEKGKKVIEESDRIDSVGNEGFIFKGGYILNFFDPNRYFLEDSSFFTIIEKDELEEFLKGDVRDCDRDSFQKILDETDWENENVYLEAS